MSHDPGSLDAALAAAIGNDPMLIAELRAAFLDSATHLIDLLSRARCDAVGSSRVDLQACKLEYSIVSPK